MHLSKEESRKLKDIKTRRGYKGRFRVKNELRLIGINANGISSKLQSFTHLISELNPSIICLQETKLRKTGKLQINGFITFELNRKNSAGGGLATMINLILIQSGFLKEMMKLKY